MSFPTTPRINSPLLNKFHDKTVRIIGKVESQDGDLVSFDANGPLKVKADGTTEYTVGKFYEVVGKVTTDDELISYSCTDFGDNIDLAQVDKLVTYCQKFPTVFGDA